MQLRYIGFGYDDLAEYSLPELYLRYLIRWKELKNETLP
jgi:hypothetical protein